MDIHGNTPDPESRLNDYLLERLQRVVVNDRDTELESHLILVSKVYLNFLSRLGDQKTVKDLLGVVNPVHEGGGSAWQVSGCPGCRVVARSMLAQGSCLYRLHPGAVLCGDWPEFLAPLGLPHVPPLIDIYARSRGIGNRDAVHDLAGYFELNSDPLSCGLKQSWIESLPAQGHYNIDSNLLSHPATLCDPNIAISPQQMPVWVSELNVPRVRADSALFGYGFVNRLGAHLFCNEHSNPEGYLAQYQVGDRSVLLPLTYWGAANGECIYQVFCPPKKRFRLFNLQRLKNHDRADVYVTDRVELAAQMQQSLDRELTLSPAHVWLGIYGGVAAVADEDWELLRGKDKRVHYLVCAHGGKFEGAYQSAKAVHERLGDRVKYVHFDPVTRSCSSLMEWDGFVDYANEQGLQIVAALTEEEERLNRMTDGKLRAAKDTPKREIIISGFAKAGKIMVIGGGPKVGKSLLSFRLARAIAGMDGKQLWEHRIPRRKRVLYYDTEMDEDDYIDRRQRQSKYLHIILSERHVLPEFDDEMELLEYRLKDIAAYVKKNGIEVLFIDCLYKLLDESNPKQVDYFIRLMKKLKAKGLLIFVVHHTRKDNKSLGPFEALAGHSNLHRAIDGGLMMMGNGETTLDSDGDETQLIDLYYQSRTFKQIPPKTIYLNSDLVHKIHDDSHEAEVDALQIRRFEYILKHFPATEEGALPTKKMAEVLAKPPLDPKKPKSTKLFNEASYLEKKEQRDKLVENGLLSRAGDANKFFFL